MKKLFILALAAMTLWACNEKKENEPEVTPQSGTTDPTNPSGGGGGGETGGLEDFAQLQGQAYYVFFLDVKCD